MAVPVIIDTDIGDNVDDALALALAARAPEIAIVGVTTVFQCAALRARMARHLLDAFGRPDVPVLAGVDRPLLGGLRPDWGPNQAAVLGELAATHAAPPGGAVPFIVRERLAREGLVLWASGPIFIPPVVGDNGCLTVEVGAERGAPVGARRSGCCEGRPPVPRPAPPCGGARTPRARGAASGVRLPVAHPVTARLNSPAAERRCRSLCPRG